MVQLAAQKIGKPICVTAELSLSTYKQIGSLWAVEFSVSLHLSHRRFVKLLEHASPKAQEAANGRMACSCWPTHVANP